MILVSASLEDALSSAGEKLDIPAVKFYTEHGGHIDHIDLIR